MIWRQLFVCLTGFLKYNSGLFVKFLILREVEIRMFWLIGSCIFLQTPQIQARCDMNVVFSMYVYMYVCMYVIYDAFF